MVQVFFSLLLSASGAGAFSGGFTTNLARQCRAFSRALKIEKVNAPLFRGPEGAGATMTGALYVIHNAHEYVYECLTL